MRVTFLGCAHIHMKDAVEAVLSHPEPVAVTVWDHQPERAAYWADRLGARLQLEPTVGDSDAVIVMSETALHRTLAEKALSAGRPLFIEKPLAASYRDAQYIAELVAQSGVLFHTGYFLREIDSLQRLRSLVLDHELGQVVRARALLAHGGVPAGWFSEYSWMLRKEDAGYGGFGDLGIHLVDLLTWILDARVSAVSACLRTVTSGLEVEDSGEALLRLQDGTLATIGAGLSERGLLFELLITGTEGYAVIRDHHLIVEAASQTTKWPMEAPSARRAVQRFLATLGGGSREMLVPVEEAARHSAVVDACYQSAQLGTWIDISP